MKNILFILLVYMAVITGVVADWANPYYAKWTNSVTVTNTAGLCTLQYVIVGAHSGTNGGDNAYSVWLIHNDGYSGTSSNIIYQPGTALNTLTNARSSELKYYWAVGDKLKLDNTNAPVTNRAMILFSDVQH